ncbi:MAG: undecaprenyl-diphosphate phosphatase [Alphaproteobacteria bacterium]|nr:undecaprenyl-diphosphate phosphatase [Alphaproteobacteria bacterium]MDP6253617.1 undecaprenyl-diphosphate phosphatase [Alphaproteobacteria bacterium]MDP7054454.1 undecaprenyl-diphosphate phosphatase [Alphaproteobacteria bacterium]MDP7230969.1 undecaprenyl-diphosphate phosphatase [Alphaproteobacteria bacterium]MDP7462243.1 undecaprenyl-diphosphate phosphatase [Alphaproteobacteria bacterium]
MSLLHLIVVAVVQGLTEFLPISSSAHLILVPLAGDWPDQGPTIDIAVHLGTLGAVMLYFRQDVAAMVMGLVSLLLGRFNPDTRLFLLIVAGTLPALAAGYILASQGFLELLRSPLIIAWTTVLFGLLLWAVDRICLQINRMEQLGFGTVLLIGLAQILALIPGTSRSGITITAARALGFERADAARISLLLSMPIILAAACYAGLEVVQDGRLSLGLDALVAAALAFVTALSAVALMMRWLRHASYTPFVIYRLVLGAGLLYWLYA